MLVGAGSSSSTTEGAVGTIGTRTAAISLEREVTGASSNEASTLEGAAATAGAGAGAGTAAGPTAGGSTGALMSGTALARWCCCIARSAATAATARAFGTAGWRGCIDVLGGGCIDVLGGGCIDVLGGGAIDVLGGGCIDVLGGGRGVPRSMIGASSTARRGAGNARARVGGAP